MQLSTDGMPLGPSVCFVCESTPPESAIVDTLLTFHPPAPSPLDGRKYLCEHCVGTAAKILGWQSPTEKLSLEQAHQEVILKVRELREELTAKDDFVRSVEAVAAFMHPVAKKPAAKKAE